jgi:hypothetical protein
VNRGYDQHAESGYPSLFIPGPADEVARTSASAGASIPHLMLGRK